MVVDVVDSVLVLVILMLTKVFGQLKQLRVNELVVHLQIIQPPRADSTKVAEKAELWFSETWYILGCLTIHPIVI